MSIRRSLILVACVAGLTMVAGAGLLLRAPAAPAATPALTAEIRFVDVGQGDAVVMRIGNKLIVSDVGESNVEAVNKALEQLNRRSTRTIDVVILTHPHQDHVLNFPALAKTWKIKTAILSDSAYWKGNATNRAVMAAIAGEGIQPTFVARSDKFSWGGAKWLMLNPPKGEWGKFESQAGNVSIAYLLELNGKRLLFTGDVKTAVGDRIAGELPAVLNGKRVDVFLMTHHGANSSSADKLNKLVRPVWVVVSAGQGNQFDHPLKKAVNRLKAIAGTGIWCTPANGTVTAKINAAGALSWTSEKLANKPWWSGGVRRAPCNKL